MLHFSPHANGFAYWYINRFLRFAGRHDRMKPVDGVICLFEYGTAAETEGRETMDIQVGDVLKLKMADGKNLADYPLKREQCGKEREYGHSCR